MVEGSAGYVLRVDPSTLEDLERSESAARESVFDRAVAEATTLREISELTTEAMRPVRDMIAADEAASAASKKLIDVHEASAAAHAGARESDNSMGIATSGSWGGVSSYSLPPGWTAFAPPFDIPDPPGVPDVHGAPCHGEADKNTGRVHVWIDLDHDADGLLVASSRVALVVRPTKSGTIDVRPWIAYAYRASASGYDLSSHIVGEIEATVTDEFGGVITTNPVEMFNRDNDMYIADRGLLAYRNPNVSFPGDPSRNYVVWFSAAIWGDQSGTHMLGTSSIFGYIDMTVQQVGVGLRP
jgi:hypothetical protein